MKGTLILKTSYYKNPVGLWGSTALKYSSSAIDQHSSSPEAILLWIDSVKDKGHDTTSILEVKVLNSFLQNSREFYRIPEILNSSRETKQDTKQLLTEQQRAS